MTTPLSPDLTSPQEPRPTLSRQLSSGSLPNVATITSPQSPKIGELLSASSPDVTTPPLRPLPQRLKSAERPRDRSYDRSPSARGRSSSPATFAGNYDEPRQIIVGSFAPRVSVYASEDTEDFIQGKGFNGGFKELIKPYAERIPGKVVARDSIGSSKAWEDFGIRIVGPDDGQPFRTASSELGRRSVSGQTSGARDSTSSAGNSIAPFEKLLDHHLRNEETRTETTSNGHIDSYSGEKHTRNTSAIYPLYLRKLLASMLMVPYETFSHPVACIIAVSSHNASPIETLRQLYTQSGRRIPTFVGPEYLRYYVLIHDEEGDDITKSTALFDLMKRHFGLHCHLLRLRSSHCVQTDDDSTPVPPSSWLPAEDDLAQISIIDYDAESLNSHYIFDSDVSAIRSFLREMVTQSIVPFMENRIMTWNDQVASRRRGLSGRFMSLSKRWTPFGSSRNSSPNSSQPSNSNYDPHLGIYAPSTPEATMRTLADYAFMLRDFRLAYSTYDFLRSDFSHDKAWAYHAAANEMAAISYLLLPQTSARSERSRAETLDQMLETATYSYLTRCSLPFGATRTLTLAFELLKSRGLEDAPRWGGRLHELAVLGPIGQAFMSERMAECYRDRARGKGILGLGAKRRQIALWSLLAAESWIRIEKPDQAKRQLSQARQLYSENGKLSFMSMRPFWDSLEQAVQQRPASQELGGRDSLTIVDPSLYEASRNTSTTQVESETMNQITVPPASPLRERVGPGYKMDPLGVEGGQGLSADADGFE